MSTVNPFYSLLAGRILVSNLHKKTTNHFVDKMIKIQSVLGLLDEKWLVWIKKNKKEINAMIDYDRDFIFDYFGFWLKLEKLPPAIRLLISLPKYFTSILLEVLLISEYIDYSLCLSGI
jgi:hypothetical protein